MVSKSIFTNADMTFVLRTIARKMIEPEREGTKAHVVIAKILHETADELEAVHVAADRR